MKTLPDKPVSAFDVDNTLIMWGDYEPNPGDLTVVIDDCLFYAHKEHICQIRDLKARGHTIVIWTNGVASWAKKVIKELQLDDCVDLIMPKPRFYYDDVLGGHVGQYRYLKADKYLKDVDCV